MTKIATTTKEARGQFFTTSPKVQAVMLGLLERVHGRVLEPSAGAGHLVKALETRFPDMDIAGVELDSTIQPVCDSTITYGDFFTYSNKVLEGTVQGFDVVFGNPPYVSWKNVEESSQFSSREVKASYSDKTNLYHLFIDRCVDVLSDGGEMVLIVPKEWLYQSSASPLRDKLHEKGHITHIVDCSGEKIFEDASVPALIIFRFVKNSSQENKHTLFAGCLDDAHKGNYEPRTITVKNGRWLLLRDETAQRVDDWGRLSDVFSVKVGLVSGADSVYRVTEGMDIEDECVAPYVTSKGVQSFINVNHVDSWEDMPPKTAQYLLQHKETLMSRRVSKFTENNWWKYGAVRNLAHMVSDKKRVYVIARTRTGKPFFEVSDEHDAKYFSSAIMGLFLHDDTVDMSVCLEVLNSDLFREMLDAMFLTSGSRIYLQPATLEDAPFPNARILR